MAAKRYPLALTSLDDRATPAGLDPAFGTGGVAVLDLAAYDQAATALVQPDGKVVALATAGDNSQYPPPAVLVRLNADGSRDTTFDGDGVVPVPGQVYGGSLGYGSYGVALGRLADGGYLVVTTVTKYPDTPPPTNGAVVPPTYTPPKVTLTLARYAADGTAAGVRTLDLGDAAAAPSSLLVREDGSVLLASPVTSFVNETFPEGQVPARVSIRRVTPAGEFDPAFGTGGTLNMDVATSSVFYGTTVRLLAAPGGRVVVTGTVGTSYALPAASGTRIAPGGSGGGTPIFAPMGSTLYAARLNADGTRDTGYGTNGLFTLPLADYVYGTNGAAVAADGSLLLSFNPSNVATASGSAASGSGTATRAGSASLYPIPLPSNMPPPTVRRVTPGGVLDTAYAGDGALELTSPHFQPGYVNGRYVYSGGVALVPAADGGAFVLADRLDGLFVQKLTAAGAVDPAYGEGGLAFLADPARVSRTEVAADVTADGSLVVVGSQSPQSGLYAPPAADLFAERVTAAAPTQPLPPEPSPNPPAPGPDCNGDHVPDVLTVTGSTLSLTDGATGQVLVSDFAPYEARFTGGLQVAFADLNRVGKDYLIVAPDVGGGARIQVFALDGGKLVRRDNFFAIDDPNFRGGARVAAGDVNGDGTPDLTVCAGPGGGPRVAIYDGRSLTTMLDAPPKLVPDFFAFPGPDAARLRDGATVAAGDVDGDGKADLAFGAGPGGAPRVVVLSGDLVAAGKVGAAQNAPLANFFSGGDSGTRGGSRVALADTDGDGRPDLTVTNVATGAVMEYGGTGIPGAVGEPAGRRIDPPTDTMTPLGA